MATYSGSIKTVFQSPATRRTRISAGYIMGGGTSITAAAGEINYPRITPLEYSWKKENSN